MTVSEPSESLDDLALAHRTDKSSAGHGYAAIYEAQLEALRDEPITMLEIGIHSGASLRMWRDYFPRGQIWGLDTNPKCLRHADDRIHVVIGNQSDPAALGLCAPGEDFDVIIDDGGHWVDEQRFSLLELWPRLKPGGLYYVEDTHVSYMDGFGDTVGMLTEFVQDVHQRGTLADVASIGFYGPAGLCLMRKSHGTSGQS